jgi:hypothetical protein
MGNSLLVLLIFRRHQLSETLRAMVPRRCDMAGAVPRQHGTFPDLSRNVVYTFERDQTFRERWDRRGADRHFGKANSGIRTDTPGKARALALPHPPHRTSGSGLGCSRANWCREAPSVTFTCRLDISRGRPVPSRSRPRRPVGTWDRLSPRHSSLVNSKPSPERGHVELLVSALAIRAGRAGAARVIPLRSAGDSVREKLPKSDVRSRPYSESSG